MYVIFMVNLCQVYFVLSACASGGDQEGSQDSVDTARLSVAPITAIS